MFRLVADKWEMEIARARRASPNGLRIVCPFIKRGAISRILDSGGVRPLEVITRFDLGCFYQGVSDLDALEMLLDAGGTVRGVKGLHAKLFLFGGETAVCTSANVTDAGLMRNHEFGFVSDDAAVFANCDQYFATLWSKAGGDLSKRRLYDWRQVVSAARKSYSAGARPRLADHGVKVGGATPLTITKEDQSYTNQAFLKFFGRGAERTPRDRLIADIVAESGCNWACTYPTSSRPRQVQDGDILYMARIAAPEDLLIFGYATAWQHRDAEDVASRAEIAARPWKKQFANYIRVHDARFVDAELAAGVSMYEMLNQLGSDSWRSTEENARAGSGNIDPYMSYLRKPAMQLTDHSRAWIDERLGRLFRKYGEVDLSPVRLRSPR